MWHERKMELITTIYDKIDEMAELELGETINDEPSKPSKRSRSIRSDLESGDSMNEEPSEPSKPIKPTKKSTICLKKIKRASEKLKMLKPADENKGLELLKDVANDPKMDGETVLHRAVAKLSFKDDNDVEVIEHLMKYFPELAKEKRPNSKNCRGQTPVHMAITKGVSKVVTLLLKNLPDSLKPPIFKTKATGTVFRNTVMMAELPLSVAALTTDQDMFKTLLGYWENGAVLDATNSKGDNVCHSLIRYAYLYPEKLEDIRAMLRYIRTDASCKHVPEMKKMGKKIWFMKNSEGLVPLQLAAKFGQDQIFKDIMEIPGYCSRNDTDCLFDIKVYDVTEIDAIAFEDPEAECYKRDEDKSETADTRDAEAQTITTNNVSILRRLLQLDPQCAFQIIAFAPVRRVIDEKWNAYRRFFYPWLVFHVVYMSFLTWYATARSLQKAPINGTIDEPDFINPILEKSSTLAPGIINIAVGVVYLAEAGLRYFLQRMPVTRISIDNPYSNLAFRLFFILFGLSLITDFICAAVINWYENYMLMLAVAIGWFLMLFFLRAFRQFSFFTVMIQNVLLGDLLRFSVIIFFELVAFSTVMFMALQGAIETDSEYIHYGRVFLSMFKLMVGLGDVGLIYQTRHPGLVIFILVGFIILTTILMINSLIAMISRTSTELVEGLGVASALDFHWKLQRLSLVLYIESILHNRSVHRGGSKKEKKWYSNRTNAREKMDRYCLEIRSLQNADKVLRSRDAGLDMKLLFSEYYRMFKSGNDKVEHHDETSTNMNEKYPTIDEECSAKSVSGLHLQPMVGGERKLDVIHHYDHCDNCDKMAEDNKNVNDGLEESA